MAFLYVCLIAIAVMFTMIIRSNAAQDKKQEISIKACADKTDRLGTEVAFLTEQIRRKDSAWAALDSKFRVFKELKIIP